jgi:hypothetical protein
MRETMGMDWWKSQKTMLNQERTAERQVSENKRLEELQKKEVELQKSIK